MTQRRSEWLIAALLCGALLAGCGSSTSGSTTTTTVTASSTSGPSSSSGAAGIVDSVAVADCKKAIKAQTVLSANAKGKLEGVCEQAGKGNTAPLKKVEREICEEAVDKSTIPGVGKAEAAAACRIK
jgi:hypothetical protein